MNIEERALLVSLVEGDKKLLREIRNVLYIILGILVVGVSVYTYLVFMKGRI